MSILFRCSLLRPSFEAGNYYLFPLSLTPIKMSQRSIKSFFQAVPVKRSLSDGNESERKKARTETDEKVTGGDHKDSKSGLQTDEKVTGGDHKDSKSGIQEEIARQVQLTPALSKNIGHSWLQGIEA